MTSSSATISAGATTAAWVQPTPFGPLSIATGSAGVHRVRFSGAGEQVGAPDPAVADAFDAYFGGDLHALRALPVDLDGLSEFSRAVLLALRDVGPFPFTSYGRLAAVVGRPAAARAVGRAVGANPVPVVIPCHRVLAAGGQLGGYSGGLEVKRWLLAHEGWPAQPTEDVSRVVTPSLSR